MRGPWQNILAEEQFTIDVEIFDLRAIVTIDVGEDRAKPVDRCPPWGCQAQKRVSQRCYCPER